MEREFWLEAWQTGRRGFHRDAVHDDLVAHGDRFAKGTVLVPLCGATHDLRWLAERGWSAVGVELSPLAAEELVAREGLEEQGHVGGFAQYAGRGIRLLVGDFFEVTPEILGPITGIWDRAALVALHPDQREAYVALQRRLLGDTGALLLNAFSYDQSVADGPPWSVDPGVVGSLWPRAESIERRPAQLPPRFGGAEGFVDLYFQGPGVE